MVRLAGNGGFQGNASNFSIFDCYYCTGFTHLDAHSLHHIKTQRISQRLPHSYLMYDVATPSIHPSIHPSHPPTHPESSAEMKPDVRRGCSIHPSNPPYTSNTQPSPQH
ncbi:hypothetical protein O3P69_019236 [Scylla paramamosain]|uniref:Uncharacterized protein n=1 Tax=Scylla paramamosain TaxID=85552 RepID=A0AAW0SV00_SCYPA